MTSALKSLVSELIGQAAPTDDPELIPANETKYDKQRRTLKEKQRRASRDAMRRLYAKRRKLGLNAHGKPFAIRRSNFNKQTKPKEKPIYAQNSFA